VSVFETLSVTGLYLITRCKDFNPFSVNKKLPHTNKREKNNLTQQNISIHHVINKTPHHKKSPFSFKAIKYKAPKSKDMFTTKLTNGNDTRF
jgi:hypothetical protein